MKDNVLRHNAYPAEVKVFLCDWLKADYRVYIFYYSPIADTETGTAIGKKQNKQK